MKNVRLFIHTILFALEMGIVLTLVGHGICSLSPVIPGRGCPTPKELEFRFADGQDELLKKMNLCLIYCQNYKTGKYDSPITVASYGFENTSIVRKFRLPADAMAIRIDFYFPKDKALPTDVVRLADFKLNGDPEYGKWVMAGRQEAGHFLYQRYCPAPCFNGHLGLFIASGIPCLLVAIILFWRFVLKPERECR